MIEVKRKTISKKTVIIAIEKFSGYDEILSILAFQLETKIRRKRYDETRHIKLYNKLNNLYLNSL